MKTRFIYPNGANKPVFQVANIIDGAEVFHPAFNENEVFICKLSFPVGNKYYRVVGLGGKVQNTFFNIYNTDMLLLENINDVEDVLKNILNNM